ncbi:MAG: T9SS type A sorting domain-containing protein [Flavobacteriales bacterium]|nr:T9SS type A sorting domain-containing protein [Flavobacteriales bacterium]MCZ2443405.1 T9SS type A sorting domain-containing protein [Flavobacteriales bacterium]
MKRIYLSILAIGVAFAVQAQSKANPGQFNTTTSPLKQISKDKAAGDTLMWLPLMGYYINPTDQSNFTIEREDVDGFALSSSLPAGLSMDYGIFYSLDLEDIDPAQGDVDSAFFWYATSWFNTPGQASNWLEMGPITIPSNGATLSWKHKMQDPLYRDGYEVLVNTVSTSHMDFTDPAIFARTDNQSGMILDSLWTDIGPISLNAYAGQEIYIAFHHNANDMFLLFLDDFRVQEGSGAAVVENDLVTMLSVYPNPFRSNTTVAFELKNNSDVVFQMYDLSGKMVMQKHAGNMAAGINQIQLDGSGLATGVYYYTLTIDGQTSSAQKIVKM